MVVIIMLFKNRIDAGDRLSELLNPYKGEDVIVYALPRGGVILGRVIADSLDAPLSLLFIKKIGHPLNPEYGICAIGEHGEMVCNDYEVEGLEGSWLAEASLKAKDEIKRQRLTYIGNSTQPDPRGKVVILVDDGISTGLSMIAAIKDMKERGPKKILVAIPVIPFDTARRLKSMCDDIVSVKVDSYYLGAVGMYYMNFDQVSDEEVILALKRGDGDI